MPTYKQETRIKTILLVEEDPLTRTFIKDILEQLDKEVYVVQNGAQAVQKLKEQSFDFILSEVHTSSDSGFDLLKETTQISPAPLVVLMTHQATIQGAVEVMQRGAFHYLQKPFDLKGIQSVFQKAEEALSSQKDPRISQDDKKFSLIANSPSMKKWLNNLDKIAKSQASVFILGESGTGKEVIAGAIHHLSNRSLAPFIKVNCAAIPESLIESEFFGHEKGAFTGAHVRKTGRFELADKGTLLLDEVTEIPLSLQSKLLRAIQEQEFERVGGTQSLKVNIRFLATSNRDMQEAIETKIFREDLYYRLNVVPIHLPPLRERLEDIVPLANHFLEYFSKANRTPKRELSQGAIDKLLNYTWPGNIRELANVIERTVVLDFDPVIQADHLYLDALASKATTSLTSPFSLPIGISLHELEKRLILETLAAHHYNKTKTANILGISPRTLRNKLHEYED